MAHSCIPCDHFFDSEQALQQHLNSAAHSFDCEECDRSFGSKQALQQHQDSPVHNFDCNKCDKSFGSNQALQQHLDSPVHNLDCDECDKSFGSKQALQQHLDSPIHKFDCNECGRSFGSNQALQQHLDSPAHNFNCDQCDRSFGSKQALQQHLDSPAHNFNCDECDRSFGSKQALQQHLDSPAHNFNCDECDRSFGSEQALQQHLDSPAHNFNCDECDRSFGSKQALQQHLDSPAHNFNCDECDKSFGSKQALQQHLDSPENRPASGKYVGIPQSVVTPVFATAVRYRSQQPTADDIIRYTKTELDKSIVSALIAAASRLLPADDTPQGIILRSEKLRIEAAEAKDAEDSFGAALSGRGLIYFRKSQQQGDVTPDVRFRQPTSICGHMCMWLEYKSFFGFRENPFPASINNQQLLKYVTQIGPGAVVYKLGFETDHVNIDGVMTFLEKEVLQDVGIEPCQQDDQSRM